LEIFERGESHDDGGRGRLCTERIPGGRRGAIADSKVLLGFKEGFLSKEASVAIFLRVQTPDALMLRLLVVLRIASAAATTEGEHMEAP